jgi:hypothetical protein
MAEKINEPSVGSNAPQTTRPVPAKARELLQDQAKGLPVWIRPPKTGVEFYSGFSRAKLGEGDTAFSSRLNSGVHRKVREKCGPNRRGVTVKSFLRRSKCDKSTLRRVEIIFRRGRYRRHSRRAPVELRGRCTRGNCE